MFNLPYNANEKLLCNSLLIYFFDRANLEINYYDLRNLLHKNGFQEQRSLNSRLLLSEQTEQ